MSCHFSVDLFRGSSFRPLKSYKILFVPCPEEALSAKPTELPQDRRGLVGGRPPQTIPLPMRSATQVALHGGMVLPLVWTYKSTLVSKPAEGCLPRAIVRW